MTIKINPIENKVLNNCFSLKGWLYFFIFIKIAPIKPPINKKSIHGKIGNKEFCPFKKDVKKLIWNVCFHKKIEIIKKNKIEINIAQKKIWSFLKINRITKI